MTVYQFELFDAERHRWTRDGRMATKEAIQALAGIPQQRTAMVVDASRIDAQGFLLMGERRGESA